MAIITDLTIETRNWQPDINRFNQPKPPSWFLKAMWDQDAALVILPSRTRENVYLIGRRRELSLRVPYLVKPPADLMKKSRYSDSDMLAERKLVMVDVIKGNAHVGHWNPAMLQQLKDRDMWEAGGADAFIEKMEAREKAADAAKRKTMIDDIDHRARDSWRSLQARTGQRNQHANSRHGQSPRAKIVSVGTL
jgi:hypothetical protein